MISPLIEFPDADCMLISPLLNNGEAPDKMLTLPPEENDDNPAFNVMLPPTPLKLSPTAIKISPACFLDDAPLSVE